MYRYVYWLINFVPQSKSMARRITLRETEILLSGARIGLVGEGAPLLKLGICSVKKEGENDNEERKRENEIEKKELKLQTVRWLGGLFSLQDVSLHHLSKVLWAPLILFPISIWICVYYFTYLLWIPLYKKHRWNLIEIKLDLLNKDEVLNRRCAQPEVTIDDWGWCRKCRK